MRTLRDLTHEERLARHEAETQQAKEAGHERTYSGEHTCDSYKCKCGWESQNHSDGSERAYNDWLKHLDAEGVVIEYPHIPDFAA